jgi:sulfur relay protein TusB/DsrH
MAGKEGEKISNGPRSFGVIVARTVSTTERPMDALRMAQAMLAQGRDVGVFLVADGVYIGKRGRTEVSALLEALIAGGVKVYASPEHLKAAGLTKDRLVQGIEVADDTYRDLVDFVMERYDKVIIC